MGVVKLVYNPPDGKYKGTIEITDFKSFKPYEVDIEYFKDKRREFSLTESMIFLFAQWSIILMDLKAFHKNYYLSLDFLFL